MSSSRPQRAAAVAANHILLGDFGSDSEVCSDCSTSDEVEHIFDVHGDSSQSSMSDHDSNCDIAPPIVKKKSKEIVNAKGDCVAANEFCDKDGCIWSPDPPVKRRCGAADIVRQRGGPTASARKESVLETWELFFTEELLQEIVHYSQEKATNLGLRVEFSIDLLKAYIGILYFRGANSDQKIPVSDLWSDSYATFYRCAMSRNMFSIISRCLRFDSQNDRERRKASDTFAAFRHVWETWNRQLRKYFIPSECITVDEQLVSTRCRSPHRVYCPKKPGKYGELIRWCCDANFRYFLNGNPRCKAPQDENMAAAQKVSNTAKSLVMSLCEPFLDSGRNVTADRFFWLKGDS